jgi:hypothetical protein
MNSVGGFGSSSGGPNTLFVNPPNVPDAWITSTQIVNRAGSGLSTQFLANACPLLGTGGPPATSGTGGSSGVAHPVEASAAAQQALQDCVAKVGTAFHEVVAYQPASRYWAFQSYETAVFLGAALVLAGFCFWWIRHRLT